MIVNEYRRADGQHLYHIDAYRLENAFDAEILDFDRMLSQGPLVIEWADRIKPVLPEDTLWIRMESTGMEHRSMMLNPEGDRFLICRKPITPQVIWSFLVLLAIDTSTSWISLALYDGVQVKYEITWQSQHHHTVELAPAIVQLFDHTGTQTRDLTGLAVATGPGSFTSLRIGVAAAKGMALGLKLPLVGIPSLDVIAYAQPLDERPLIAVLHAGRSRLAYVTYLVEGDQWCPQHEPAVLDAKDLG